MVTREQVLTRFIHVGNSRDDSLRDDSLRDDSLSDSVLGLMSVGCVTE
jgi:hypothetical protein